MTVAGAWGGDLTRDTKLDPPQLSLGKDSDLLVPWQDWVSGNSGIS